MKLQDFLEFIQKLDWSDAPNAQLEQNAILGLYKHHFTTMPPTDWAQLHRLFAQRLGITVDQMYQLMAMHETGRAQELRKIHAQRTAANYGQTILHTTPVTNVGTGLYPKGGWIGRFMYEYCDGMESPDSYLFWAGVAVLSAVTRRKFVFQFAGHTLFTNQYIFFVSKPGRARKGPPIRAAEHFAKTVPDVNMIQKTSGERLPHDLAYRFLTIGTQVQRVNAEANGFMCAEELSAFIGEEGYMRVTADYLLDWWDCPAQRKISSHKHNIVTLDNVHITILGGTTPEALEKSFPQVIIGTGMMSRVIIVAEDRSPKQSVWGAPNRVGTPIDQELTDWLAYINTRTGIFTVSPDGNQWMHQWYKQFHIDMTHADDLAVASIERKQAFIIKLAMILAISENLDTVLNVELFVRAERIITALEQRAPEVITTLSTNYEGKKFQRVLHLIKSHNPHISRAELLRGVSPYGVDKLELNRILETLEERDEIETVILQTSRKQTTHYRMKGAP